MKNTLSIMFLFALLVSCCIQDELAKNSSALFDSLKFTASLEQDNSRTYIEKGKLLRWNTGDQISLFVSNTLNSQYQFDGKTGDNSGTFSPVATPFGTGNLLNSHYAVYPYSKDITITDDTDEVIQISTTLPVEQYYAVNSFGPGANTMVAVTRNTDDTFLNFKNVCGYLKLQLYGSDVTVKSITLKGNSKEKLAGKSTITPTYSGAPSIRMADDAAEIITLNCGEGVELGATSDEATVFWMVVPPVTFEKGISITVTDIDGGVFTQTTANEVVVERNVIKPMAALEVQPQVQDDGIPYLTFSADAAQTLTMSKAVATFEYSVGDGEWKELGTTTVNFGGTAGDLRLRGKSAIGTSTPAYECAIVTFGNENVMVAASGDIRTLVDYKKFDSDTLDTSKALFKSLFEGCTVLTSAPKLPLTNLAFECYYSMFKGCTNLVEAPELPATTLIWGCYGNMFEDCTSLTEAPALPALEMAPNCYTHMFKGCTSLIVGPVILATTCAQWACSHMFDGCTGLKEAPVLSATKLGTNCYQCMFKNCTNLTKAFALPATTLTMKCYSGMFMNCTSLIEAPEIMATTFADGLEGSSSLQSMFEGCTSLTKAPELPITTLNEGSYIRMFYGCTSLTKAPILPAVTLTRNCYAEMFAGCSKLAEVTMLATDINAMNCLYNWLNGTASAGIIYKNSVLTDVSALMVPEGWEVKNK